MTVFYTALTAFLLLNIAFGLFRIIRGPSPADRLMAAQLFGTTGMAVLLVLAEVMNEPGLRNAALVFALLAVLVVVCFVSTPEKLTKPGK